MKRQWIYLIGGVLLAVAICLAVFLPKEPGPSTDPTGSTGSTGLPHGSSTNPTNSSGQVILGEDAAVRLFVCGREDHAALEALAAQYQAQSGISCQIVTGNLENMMESEEMPTIFCIHSQTEAEKWADRMLDLTGSAVLEALLSQAFALKLNEKPVAVAMEVECYGLIYNAALLAQAGYTRSDITDLASLQAIAGYITGDRKMLGFDAFCQADWSDTVLTRYLAGISADPAEIRSFFDLYISNSTAKGNPLEQFVAGEVVFYVGGLWEYDQIAALGLNNLDVLPLYTAAGGGFHCTSDFYWCVNSAAPDAQVAASLDFLRWLVTAGEDGAAPADSLNTLLPFADTDGARTAFDRLLRKYLAEETVYVRWEIAEDLTAEALSNLTLALSEYAENATEENWAVVVSLLK